MSDITQQNDLFDDVLRTAEEVEENNSIGGEGLVGMAQRYATERAAVPFRVATGQVKRKSVDKTAVAVVVAITVLFVVIILIIKKRSGSHPTKASAHLDDDVFYEQVAEELKADNLQSGVWTRAFAEANGDENRAKAIYIKLRVAQLLAEVE